MMRQAHLARTGVGAAAKEARVTDCVVRRSEGPGDDVAAILTKPPLASWIFVTTGESPLLQSQLHSARSSVR